jgi:diguanylate cyclase (GGDEF)-like protein
MINPTRRRLARLVLPVLLLFFVTIGIALYQTVSQVNALDAQRARAAMAVALDGLMASLADYAHDNAAWDDAARAVYAPAPDTRFIATTWGEATGEHVYADAFMIVDASGAVRSAYRDGLATAPALSPELRRTLHVLRTRALHSGQGAAALVRRDGWITLVGVAPVRPTSRALDGLVPAAGPSIIAFQRDLTARDAARIGTSLQLPGVSFAARPHGATSAPVRDVEGRVIAGVTWAPTYTGSIALGRALPVILIAGVLYLIAAGFAFNRGYASLRQLGWQAMADSLSKLPNRRALRWEMVRRADMKADIGLAIVDLDGFKRVNDSFGHETGDQLIRAVALILKQAAGNEAMAVRLSGDEFALLAHGPDAHDTIERVSQRLLAILTQPVMAFKRPVQVGASIGIVAARLGEISPSEAMRRADTAMYEAKKSGKMRIVWYCPELERDQTEVARLTAELRNAIEHRELVAMYQPMIDSRTGEVRAVEALLRWPSIEHGEISTREFISVADQAGLTVSIGALVLSQAAIDAAKWPDVRLSINLSRGQLRSPGFVEVVARQMAEAGVDPSRIDFELRETLFVENPDFAEEVARELRLLGVGLVLDNFGAGHASFATLDLAQFSKVKIDSTLVARAPSDERALVLLQSCVSYAHVHGARVVAQGVETFAQAELMRVAGCDEIQGWTYGRPIQADDVTALLSATKRPGVQDISCHNGAETKEKMPV